MPSSWILYDLRELPNDLIICSTSCKFYLLNVQYIQRMQLKRVRLAESNEDT